MITKIETRLTRHQQHLEFFAKTVIFSGQWATGFPRF